MIQPSIAESSHSPPAIPKNEIRATHVSNAFDLESAFEHCECIQLSPGSFSGTVTVISAGCVQLAQQKCSRGIGVTRKAQPHRLLIGYINGPGAIHEHGRTWLPGQILVAYGADVAVSALSRADLVWIDIDLSGLNNEKFGFLRRILHPTEVPLLLSDNGFADVGYYVSGILQLCLSHWSLLDNDAMRRHIEADVLTRVCRAFDVTRIRVTSKKREHKAFSLVQRVERFMWENVEEPLTLDRVCKNMHCCTRSLIYSFKDSFEIGPIRYLKILRLNAVHRRLTETQGQARIFEVAADFGFWHMGHFSADYKRMFGTTASETLASGNS